MAAQPISVALSDTSNTTVLDTAELRRPNFPLPRELRDHIYGYLLHSDYTRVERKWKQTFADGRGFFERQGYRFHTNILAVNRAIHDEAQEYIFKNNTFVVASADWQHMKIDRFFSHDLYTPVITETKAARMRYHSLRLHIKSGQSVQSQNLDPSKKSGKISTQSCLLLLKDLDALCATLSCHVARRPAFALLIEDDPTPSRSLLTLIGWDGVENEMTKPSRLMVQFLNTPFRTTDASMQRNMLASLRDFTGTSMRVTFDGVLPEHFDHAQCLKDIMGPVLISRRACDWIRFGTLSKAKQCADDAMCAGELVLAGECYKTIMQETRHYLDALATAPHLPWPTIAPLNIMSLDLFLTLFYLQLKLGKLAELNKFTMRLKEIIAELEDRGPATPSSQLDLSETLEAVCHHFNLLGDLYFEDIRDPGVESRLSVGHMVKILSRYQHLPYQSYDLAILSKVANHEDSALQHLPLRMCSLSILPPKCFYFHQDYDQKPDHIIGMQNLEVLRHLDDATKMQINSMEQQYGQKITKWE